MRCASALCELGWRQRDHGGHNVAGSDIVVADTLTCPRSPPSCCARLPSRTRRLFRAARRRPYELAFPPGAAHSLAALRADGTVIELR